MSGPYIREIRQNTPDSHQTSPGYLLTFLRWSNRDVFNYTNAPPDDTRRPLVVYNDATQVVVSNSKSSLSPTMSAVLKGGDINYATAVHPGDFVLVNMVNWQTDAERIRDKAVALKPINELADGFKGVYRIQSVAKALQVDRNTGAKSVTYTITAAGFTEFNNVMYYNPAIAAEFANAGTTLWSTAIGDYYQTHLKTNSDIQTILSDLFVILIGKSLKDKGAKIPNFGNSHFILPAKLGPLLGRDGIKHATDLFNYVLGVWGSSTGNINDQKVGVGFNPGINRSGAPSNFFATSTRLQGNIEVSLENWNNNTAWSILQSYTNAPMNEMYTTYRIAPDNRVYPTVVVRQKPFTSEHFSTAKGNNIPVTRFLSLPRWKISANLLLDLQTSKNDAIRFNFVQVYTRALADTAEQDMAAQIALGNFVADNGDIQRQGLRPYVQTSNFDFPSSQKVIRAKPWANIIGDWVIDGHLKESGSMTFIGIQDPISVGDNIEFDNIVYHIESVSHHMSISSAGNKNFITKLTVSYGMDKRSSAAGPVYANMEHTDAYTTQKEDYRHERIMPGISDTQDIRGRVQGEETNETRQASFTPPILRKQRAASAETNSGEDRNYNTDSGGFSTGKGKKKKK